MKSPALRLTLRIAVILLALGSMYMSYRALREVAGSVGFAADNAIIFPLILDLVTIVAMLIALTSEHGRKYAWSVMVIFGCFTVTGNAIHVTTIDPSLIVVPLPVAIVASSIPALSLLLVTHLAAVSVFRPSVTTSDRVDPKPTVLELAGEGQSIAQIQRATGVARSTVNRWVTAARG